MGGNGWQSFDAVIRQNAAVNPLRTDWTSLEPSLLASTFCRERDAERKFCVLCSEGDHLKDQCALAPLLDPLPSTAQQSYNRSRARPFRSRSPTTHNIQICNSWNAGRCKYPGTCNYAHICSLCNKTGVAASHRARDCVKNIGPPVKHPGKEDKM